MSAMKLLTVVGARPQFVKAAALSRELSKHAEIEEILVHTGQHFDERMSEVFFQEMEIPKPAYNLEINSLNHGAMTGRMLEEIEKLLVELKPDMVLVYGDTNSTLAGALAAKKLHIPVGHVEAGLRSFNMAMPEEVNRILTDRISDLLFCPTETAVKNLRIEGFDGFSNRVSRTGDVMQDAAYFYAEKAAERSTLLRDLGMEKEAFVLATLHRAENTDDPTRLQNLCEVLGRIHQEIPVVLPLHPRTRKKLEQTGLELKVKTIEPVGYFDMIELIRSSSLVMTDSGGLQKEAFFFGKHAVTLRDQTEWVELVEHGFNQIAGADPARIYQAYQEQINRESNFDLDLYGGGKASQNIANELITFSKHDPA